MNFRLYVSRLHPTARVILSVFSLVLLSHETYSQPYMQRSITEALDYRDEYFNSISLPAESLRDSFTTASQLNTLQLRLEQRPAPGNPWYNVLRGIVESARGRIDPSPFFGNALNLTSNNPGATWLLFIEFNRYGQDIWAVKALEQLDKHFLASAISAAPEVAQQLMHIARTHEHEGNTQTANLYYGWADAFDPANPWPSLRIMRNSLLFNPARFYTALVKLIEKASTSRKLQCTIVSHAFRGLSLAVSMAVIALLAAFFLKYFTRATHGISELFPGSVPGSLRTFFLLLFAFSFLLFGFIPFVWCWVIMLWPRLAGKEKLFSAFFILAVVLAPVGCRIEDALRASQSPTNTPALFLRALEEGHDPDLKTSLETRIREKPDDYLAFAGNALVEYKNNNFTSAYQQIEKAYALNPDDPVVLVTAGVLAHHAGHTRESQDFFEQCTRLFPANPIGFFNYGAWFLDIMETVDGMNQIARATDINSALTNSFIERSDYYFDRDWPLKRQFMLADYTPGYFWTHVFSRYRGSWESTRGLWGSSFFGFSPAASQIIFIVLFILLASHFVIWVTNLPDIKNIIIWRPPARRFSRILSCELCDAPLCTRCGKGLICEKCYSKLQTSLDEGERQTIKARIRRKRRIGKELLASGLDIVYPGVGMLYAAPTRPSLYSVLLIVFSSCIYVCLLYALTATFAYPRWVFDGIYQPIAGLLLVYFLIFLIRGIKNGYRAVLSEDFTT